MEKKQRKKQQVFHWTFEQRLHHNFALILYAEILGRNKKKTSFYVKLAKLLNKDNQKCRSHHMKMLNTLKKKKKGTIDELLLLYKFYFENIIQRNVDEAHLRNEIRRFLQEKKLNQQEYDFFLKKMQNNLEDLQLKKNSQLFFKEEPIAPLQQEPNQEIDEEQQPQKHTKTQDDRPALGKENIFYDSESEEMSNQFFRSERGREQRDDRDSYQKSYEPI